MPFREVLEFLQSKNLIHLAPSVARLKISDQKALLELDAATLRKHEWDPTDITFLLRATGKEVTVEKIPSIPVPRSDFPKLEPRGRGSLKRAIGAAFPNCRSSSIAALQDDFYANSSQASQASLWNTWTTLATAWGLPPIPITRELLLSVGASMKHAGYRSHKNYFYKAAQVHRETLGQDIPTDLHLLMQKILRSIKRGQGPTPFKDAFELELFHVPLQRRLDITRSGDWFNDRFAARDITLIACWWMLRGIEAAAARLQHILTPEQARKLAGKCSFTTTQLFGRVGRAALRALYDKAFSNTDTINSHTQRHHSITQHSPTLPTTTTSITTTTNTTYHHLHRCILQGRRSNTTMLGPVRPTTTTSHPLRRWPMDGQL